MGGDVCDRKVIIMNSEVNKKTVPTLYGSLKGIPQVDKTLTKEGCYADAKAVGDILRGEQRAVNFSYDSNGNGLEAETIQEAIDELKSNADEFEANVAAQMETKAPSGYGLGTHATGLVNVDLNDVTKTGFYCFDTGVGVENAPTSLPSIFGVHPFYNGSYAEQKCILLDGKGTKLRRIKHNDVWQPWEYENPPMTLWEEYRTTERWMGKPVYTKLVSYTPSNDIGNSGGTYGFAIEFSTPSFEYLTKFAGSINMESGNVFPGVNTDGGFFGVNFMNSGGIALALSKKIIPAGTTIYLQLWYTKTTD